MRDQYDVTIGIPVYRAVNYIEDTINSALNQTFSDIEFLIVDDCGNDGTIDYISFLQNYNHRGKDIRILKNDKNHGVSFCRNRIIDEARGKYLYFMDADDMIEPNTIQILFDAVMQNQSQVAYGSYEIIDTINNSSKRVYQKASKVFVSEDELALYAFKNNNVFHVSVCNCLIDLSFLRQIGLKFLNVSYWEDMAFTSEFVTRVNKAVLLPDVTYHYICRPDSLSHFQERVRYDKQEIMSNIFVLDYLKRKCIPMRGKIYLPYLCYTLEMNSFYAVCHIMRHFNQIYPRFKWYEIKEIMHHPMRISKILLFRQKQLSNLFFFIMSVMPISLFKSTIWFICKYIKGKY